MTSRADGWRDGWGLKVQHPSHASPRSLFLSTSNQHHSSLCCWGGGRAQSNPAGPWECTVLSAAMCPSLKLLRTCQKNGAVPKELGIGQLLVTYWLRCVQVVGIIAVCRIKGRNPIHSSQVSVICFPFATINHNSAFPEKKVITNTPLLRWTDYKPLDTIKITNSSFNHFKLIPAPFSTFSNLSLLFHDKLWGFRFIRSQTAGFSVCGCQGHVATASLGDRVTEDNCHESLWSWRRGGVTRRLPRSEGVIVSICKNL